MSIDQGRVGRCGATCGGTRLFRRYVSIDQGRVGRCGAHALGKLCQSRPVSIDQGRVGRCGVTALDISRWTHGVHRSGPRRPLRLPHSQVAVNTELARAFASVTRTYGNCSVASQNQQAVSPQFPKTYALASVPRPPLHHRRTRGRPDAPTALVAVGCVAPTLSSAKAATTDFSKNTAAKRRPRRRGPNQCRRCPCRRGVRARHDVTLAGPPSAVRLGVSTC
mgnify:FL=1